MAANQKTVNLALQGGGAHGAFAWGVLDLLMEDGRLLVDGLSATSAGAMNAAVYARVTQFYCLERDIFEGRLRVSTGPLSNSATSFPTASQPGSGRSCRVPCAQTHFWM